MCTVVVLRRPDHEWPLILAANRDEALDRPWQPPARHWPDRPEVTAGLDELAGGTWLGVNDHGVVAGILNRHGSLGPAEGYRSRGELPLEALDHADASSAAEALSHLDGDAYRTFNMVVADNEDAYWLRHAGAAHGSSRGVEVLPIPAGVSMITSEDLNDPSFPRVHTYLPRFRKAKVPDPETGDWEEWHRLLASRLHDPEDGPGGAMTIVNEFRDFGTVSSSLIALPFRDAENRRPIWLFAAGGPDKAEFLPIF